MRKRRQEQEKQIHIQENLKDKNQEQEYTLLGDSWEGAAETADASVDNRSVERLENYSYFDNAKIEASMQMSKSQITKGRKLCSEKKIAIQEVNVGFDQFGEVLSEVKGVGQASDESWFSMSMVFSRTRLVYQECHCPK